LRIQRRETSDITISTWMHRFIRPSCTRENGLSRLKWGTGAAPGTKEGEPRQGEDITLSFWKNMGTEAGGGKAGRASSIKGVRRRMPWGKKKKEGIL